jgi:hypothetical protein
MLVEIFYCMVSITSLEFLILLGQSLELLLSDSHDYGELIDSVSDFAVIVQFRDVCFTLQKCFQISATIQLCWMSSIIKILDNVTSLVLSRGKERHRLANQAAFINSDSSPDKIPKSPRSNKALCYCLENLHCCRFLSQVLKLGGSLLSS